MGQAKQMSKLLEYIREQIKATGYVVGGMPDERGGGGGGGGSGGAGDVDMM